jgi:hypothetical protein
MKAAEFKALLQNRPPGKNQGLGLNGNGQGLGSKGRGLLFRGLSSEEELEKLDESDEFVGEGEVCCLDS